MITLETGLPGAGKTLYCVGKLLAPLVGATVKYEDEQGETKEAPRTFYTNINGLLLEHEKIGAAELMEWHKWAKPGSVIIFDEVQKPWPLAPAGSKVPDCIQALETHRHMGVDIILPTQHPMLIHANVCRLVGRHLHIRRMGNMGLAVVYEWDSCSKTLLYKNSISKGPFKYDKEIFKLYKSAEMHTKTPRRLPSLVYGLGIGLAIMSYFAPVAYSRISERINPKPAVTPAQFKTSPNTKIEGGQLVTTSSTTVPNVSNTYTPTLAGGVAAPVFAGCVASGSRCQCYDSAGAKMEVEKEQCTKSLDLGATPKHLDNFSLVQTPSETRPGDLEVLAAINKPRLRPMALNGY